MEHMIRVQITDLSGHLTLERLSPSKTAEKIQQNSSLWCYADNRLVQPNQMDEANLSTVSSIKMMPAFVGGQY